MRLFIADDSEVLRERLVEVLSGQAEMPELVESFIKSLDFEDETMASRWWPLGREKPIIIDPKFNFGHPAVDRYGVGTDILAKAVQANGGSINLVANWYDIPETEIRAALEFEEFVAA